jgi:serine/threonine-protein kinase RsbW
MLPAYDPFTRSDTHDLVIRAEPASIRAALLQITAVSPVRDLSPDQRATVELVLAEVLNNVAEHAYADSAGPVAVTVALHAGMLVCDVVDDGIVMPGGILPDGRLPETGSDRDLPEGGFGWHLIRSLTCDVAYRRQRGSNRLSFVIPLSDA